jgi:Interferon-induced transmembrane protein
MTTSRVIVEPIDAPPYDGRINTTLPLVLSVICTIVFGALGVGALVYAANAYTAQNGGDLAKARSSANKAIALSAVGIVVGAVFITYIVTRPPDPQPLFMGPWFVTDT